MNCPDPMEDMPDYDAWCEAHPCPECDGGGEVDDDCYDDQTKDCPTCQGSGVDPMANEPFG